MAMFKKGDKVKITDLGVYKVLLGVTIQVSGEVIKDYGTYCYVSVGTNKVLINNTLLVKEQSDTTFNSQAEIWQYLLTGEVIEDTTTKIQYKFINSNLHLQDSTGKWVNGVAYNFDDFKNIKKLIKQPEWYENIPKRGILCWVGAETNSLTHPKDERCQIVFNYIPNETRPYKTKAASWEMAIPVTPEEAATLIYHAKA